MNRYEEKKQARIDYYKEKAGEAQSRSNQLCQESSKMLSVIPFGQPILVGHHSERSDRNYRDRASNKMENSMKEQDKAGYYAQKAEAAENNNAISSDDPDAIDKLKEKLADLETAQTINKEANAYYRKHKTMKGFRDMSDERTQKWDEDIKDSLHKCPCPSYRLTNNNANIKRIKDRIKELESIQELSDEASWDFDGGYVEMNTEDNRIQIFFDDKPDETVRTELKMRGFRWAPSVGAWQRQLNGNGLYAVKRIKCIQPAQANENEEE